jgi:hypothetical protein
MSKRKVQPSPSVPTEVLATDAEPKQAGRKRASAPSAELPAFTPPYPPSWFDRLRSRLDRGHISAFVVYGLLGLGLFVMFTLVQWREGGYRAGEIRPFHIVFACWIPFMLALMHYLDHLAVQAFATFQPALSATPEVSRDLQYRLTTLPAATVTRIGAGVVILNAVMALIDSLITRKTGQVGLFGVGGQLFQIAPTPLSMTMTVTLVFGLWWMFGTFLFHTVHQLRVISCIYGRHTRLRLLHLGPLYTFSRVTQRTAIGILVFIYAFFITASDFRTQPALLITSSVLFAIIAAIIFAWPLLGVHRLLVAEKDRLLDENTRRLEAGIADLHERIDRRNLKGMDDLNKALASLDLERSALAHIPTWPWEHGTLRGLLVALFVPIVIWAIQLGAERLLP